MANIRPYRETDKYNAQGTTSTTSLCMIFHALQAAIIEHTGYFAICGARGCIRSCNDILERSGRIEQTFHNPYYKKELWSLPLNPENPSRGVNPYREDYLDEHYPGIRENEYEKPDPKDE